MDSALIQIKPLPARNATELTAVANREVFEDFPGVAARNGDLQRWSNFRSAYHKAQQLAAWPAFPLQIDFELNSTCNMACSFCTHGHEKVPTRFLSWPDFARVIDEGSRHGLASIKLNYINEPLLVKNLHEFVRYAKSRGVLNVYFATNGLLLDARMGYDLIKSGVTKIMISLDATTPETFRAVRGNDKFATITQNIRDFILLRNGLCETFPKLRVNFLVSRLNASERQDFLSTWDGIADSIGFQTQVGIPGIEDEVFHGNGTNGERFRCSFPFKLVVIDSAGHILPCCTFSGRSMPLGHISTMTVEEAWNSPKMISLKRLHERGGYTENPVCRHCIHGTSA